MNALTVKPVAFIDMDGSIANYDRGILAKMNEITPPGEPEIKELFIDANGPWREQQRHLISSQTGFWRNLEPITEGMGLVQGLEAMGYRIIVLTKGPRKKNFAWAEKKDWCDQYLPGADVVVTTCKDVMVGEILYDDWPPYFEAWLDTNPQGLVVMRDTPSNRGYYHPQVLRLTPDNCQEILHQIRLRSQNRD